MENNYSVYQHVTPDNMYYFGATSNIKRRWRCNGAEYKRTALQPYIEKFGWDNIQHIVLFREQTKENALWIEDFLIETAREDGVCINKNRSGNVSKEEGYQQQISKQYYEENKQQMREQHKEYQEKNKDKINKQKRKYYERNKVKFKEYREQNKEQIRKYQREYQREYREQNKEQIRKYQREYKRQYRQRKKLEKQLKEVETTLF